ncbi:MAG: hypothetical protein QOD26_2106 [Betaproteobacteria bacterium]|nr:hypothetical protein [Betaproteobacteria bacterium]
MTVRAADPAPDILVVDDDPILRDLLADWLQGAGYRVRTANDCEGALLELGQRAAALVVSDMYMPGACGLEAIDRIKRRQPAVGLIVVSGRFNSGEGLTRDAALGAGADRALAKPLKRSELLRAVTDLIGTPPA